jgi:hypothetical protein
MPPKTTAKVIEGAKPNLSKNDPAQMTSYRFQLVCHGMMMFHWDYLNDPDHITILIHEMSAHKVALSTQPGALSSTGSEDNLFGGPGDYELKLSPNFIRPASGAFAPDAARDVVLDSRNLKATKLSPKRHLLVNRTHVTHTLKVPYPSQVIRGRVASAIDSANPALYAGSTAETFHVNPTEVAGMHVFTYDGVQAAQLMKAGLVSTNGPWSLDKCFKLYLYSEERKDRTMPKDHLQDFNKLVTSDINQFKAGQMVLSNPDLAKNGERAKQADGAVEIRMYGNPDDTQAPPCLATEDYRPLNQFPLPADPVTHTGKDTQMAKMAANNNPGNDTPQQAADPIQCLQGWGT